MSVAPLDSGSLDKKLQDPLGFASSALLFLQEKLQDPCSKQFGRPFL